MGKENVKKFFEGMEQNSDLKEKFLAEIKKSESSEGVTALGRAAGFDFSKEDIDDLRHEVPDNSELSNDDLSNVSGGVSVRKFPTHWA